MTSFELSSHPILSLSLVWSTACLPSSRRKAPALALPYDIQVHSSNGASGAPISCRNNGTASENRRLFARKRYFTWEDVRKTPSNRRKRPHRAYRDPALRAFRPRT